MNTEGKQRLIIFVAGGVTHAEMRLAYVLGQSLGKDVYMGQCFTCLVLTSKGWFDSRCMEC